MRAVLVRSGGFGGLTRTWRAEPPGLSPEGEARLRGAAGAAGFLALPTVRQGDPAPDAFQYLLTIEDGPGSHAVRFDDASAGEELLALVELVQDLSEG
ncbi:MAG TPA: protealysin inhibitor emfourin [Anaeromyxobacteraceae bacterium]